jgi:adenylate kinase
MTRVKVRVEGDELIEGTLLIVGPPGLDVTRVSAEIGRALGTSHLSVAQLLETAIRNRTAVGGTAERFVADGSLVPDQLVLRLVDDALRSLDQAADPRRGCVLGGAPHTVRQAEALCVLARRGPVQAVVHLDASDGVLRSRLSAQCHTPRDRRRAQRRLSHYRVRTLPALAWMSRRRPVVPMDATLSPGRTAARLLAALDDHGLLRRRISA